VEIISSTQNSLIKEIKSLKLKKYREEKDLYYIEGIKFVDEAIKEGVEILKVLISDKLYLVKGGQEIVEKVEALPIEEFIMSEKLFKVISDTENPQGIIAVIKSKKYQLSEIIRSDNFLVILDSIQDPGNLGTIIRTADAAGVTGIIISDGSVDLHNSKVLRSTMGSIFHVPIYHSADLLETIKSLKEAGIKIYSTHLSAKTNYSELEYSNNIGVVIGNESNGVSEEVRLQSDLLFKIDMHGKAESLNAAVAAGLIMFEIARKR